MGRSRTAPRELEDAQHPLRVLHIQKATGIGGSERHLTMLLPALERAGVHVRMLVLEAGDGERFAEELRDAGITTDVIRAGLDLSPGTVRRIGREIAKWQPDLVHTHLIHADVHGLAAARRAGVPAVSSVHDTLAALRRRPVHAVAARAGRVPAVTIAISHHVRRYLESLALRPPGSVRVVHYGIDASDWEPERGARAAARKRFHLGPADVAVAITSRIVPGKGHPVLFEAYQRALVHAPSLKLIVAGSGPLRRTLERDPNSEGVQFVGFQADVRPIVHAADVLAFPTSASLSEGFGLTALEAMAAGRPVVGSHVGAIPEVVADGETGLLVEPDDAEPLAAALVRMARNPGERAAMGRRGADRAEHDFSLSQMVNGTLAVYSEALGRPVVAPQPRPERWAREVAHAG